MTNKTRREALLLGLQAGLAGSVLTTTPARAAIDIAPRSDGNIDWVENHGARDPFRHAANLRTVKTPHLRALCKTEKGVKRAFQWARQTGTPFSVRSGGHCFEGLSQNKSLIIDMRYMNQTALSPDGTIATVGPGAMIQDVNALTAPASRILPAGFCQTVGLGGHVGGGGMGLTSRAFGLACDHLESARILTADGHFKTASATENPDLYWALRGGGSGSFGIVTSSKFRTREVPSTTFIDIRWRLSVERAAKLVSGWQNWAMTLGNLIGSVVFCENSFTGDVFVRIFLVSLDSKPVTVKAARALVSIEPPLATPQINIGSFQAVADEIWPRDNFPVRSFKIASDYLPGPVPAEVWTRTLTELLSKKGGLQGLIVDALGGAVADIAPTETAYVHRRDGRFLVQYDVTTPTAQPDPRFIAGLRRVQATLKEYATGGAYVNYPDRDLPNWAEAYWGENLPRLQRIKQKYDPQNLFRHAQSIPM